MDKRFAYVRISLIDERRQVMESIQSIYKIGLGPSSSHTMAIEYICLDVLKKYPKKQYEVILYGSLALTGKGHFTDIVIEKTLRNVTINFDHQTHVEHPNTMDVVVLEKGEEIDCLRYESVGGGAFRLVGEEISQVDCYPHHSFEEIKAYCTEHGYSLSDYVKMHENESLLPHLRYVWQVMQETIETGLEKNGVLPGQLRVKRKAKSLYDYVVKVEDKEETDFKELMSYAYATSEQNASGARVVTSPTCGASGVVPAVLYFLKRKYHLSDDTVFDALMVGGLIGSIIRHNASISGAVAGCQAEIGSACSMAAAARGSIFHHPLDTIEYAAEMAMEHHLGLTCDPILGYVQIPCIERNAMAAIRAIDASRLSYMLPNSQSVSFDTVIQTMYQTGKDLTSSYKETSLGGLATFYRQKEKG